MNVVGMTLGLIASAAAGVIAFYMVLRDLATIHGKTSPPRGFDVELPLPKEEAK